MKKILFFLLFGYYSTAISQTISEIDSVSYVMCDFLENSEIENDTLKINALFEQQFHSYLSTIEQSKVQKTGEQMYFRLQRNCVAFRSLLDRLDPPTEKVTRVTEKPISKISKKELKEFKKQKEFYYFEVAGDTTTVVMKNGKWTDYFTDNTVSNLAYNWINATEFELIFIESNNVTRANFIVKGDKYLYQVISKSDGFYTVSVAIPGQNVYEDIKLYYK